MAVQIIPTPERRNRVLEGLSGLTGSLLDIRNREEAERQQKILEDIRNRSLTLEEQRTTENIRASKARDELLGRDVSLREEAFKLSKQGREAQSIKEDLADLADLERLISSAVNSGDLNAARFYENQRQAIFGRLSSVPPPTFTEAARGIGVVEQVPLDLERPVGAAAEETITPPPGATGQIGPPPGLAVPQQRATGGLLGGEIGGPAPRLAPIPPQPPLAPTEQASQLDAFSAAQADFPLVPETVIRRMLEDGGLDPIERRLLAQRSDQLQSEEGKSRRAIETAIEIESAKQSERAKGDANAAALDRAGVSLNTIEQTLQFGKIGESQLRLLDTVAKNAASTFKEAGGLESDIEYANELRAMIQSLLSEAKAGRESKESVEGGSPVEIKRLTLEESQKDEQSRLAGQVRERRRAVEGMKESDLERLELDLEKELQGMGINPSDVTKNIGLSSSRIQNRVSALQERLIAEKRKAAK